MRCSAFWTMRRIVAESSTTRNLMDRWAERRGRLQLAAVDQPSRHGVDYFKGVIGAAQDALANARRASRVQPDRRAAITRRQCYSGIGELRLVGRLAVGGR